MLDVFDVVILYSCGIWGQRLVAPVIYGKPRYGIVIVGPIKNVVDIVSMCSILKASCPGNIYGSPDIPQPLARAS